MTDREKLVELISDFVVHVPHEEGQTWEEACADHLLANGVTVLPEKEKPVHSICMFWDTGHGLQWCNQLVCKKLCNCNGRPEKCDYPQKKRKDDNEQDKN